MEVDTDNCPGREGVNGDLPAKLFDSLNNLVLPWFTILPPWARPRTRLRSLFLGQDAFRPPFDGRPGTQALFGMRILDLEVGRFHLNDLEIAYSKGFFVEFGLP